MDQGEFQWVEVPACSWSAFEWDGVGGLQAARMHCRGLGGCRQLSAWQKTVVCNGSEEL